MLIELSFHKTAETSDKKNLTAGLTAGAYYLGGKASKRLNNAWYDIESSRILKKYGPGDIDSPAIRGYIRKKGLEHVKFEPHSYDYFSPNPHTIGYTTPINESSVLHELGHAASRLDRSINYGILRNSLYRTKIPVAIATALTAEDPRWAALPLAVSAPVIGSEIGASTRALKQLISTYGLSKGLSKGRDLIPALGTYISMPIALALGTRHIIKNKKD